MRNQLLAEKLATFYQGKKVLVTGHSGFKGAWLSQWLHDMGSRVTGLSIDTPTNPALSKLLKLSESIEEHWVDINDRDAVCSAVEQVSPDLVFHLAAQPIVLTSYETPAETFQTNLCGTINVLEALRGSNTPCAAVFITSDKCYENKNQGRPFTEERELGGNDPYSASKACAEIAIASYRKSFFSQGTSESKVGIASARAGNVIGGGDWSKYRILPDCVRYLSKGEVVPVRNPHSIRPWQHVLEPLFGYLCLGQKIGSHLLDPNERSDTENLSLLTSAFNFGPPGDQQKNIASVVDEVLKHWPGDWGDQSSHTSKAEADTLTLDSQKATDVLDWHPILNFEESIRYTVEWYKNFYDEKIDPLEFTRQQIRDYKTAVNKANALSL